MAKSAEEELAQYLANSKDTSLEVADEHHKLGEVVMQTTTVKMKPFGKARPRVVQKDGRSHTYMPGKYERRRDRLRELFGPVRVRGKLDLRVTAVRPMPKSWSQKKRDERRGEYHPHTPDVDNIIGAVMDALFAEDSHVVSIVCEKVWGDEGELEITVTRVDL